MIAVESIGCNLPELGQEYKKIFEGKMFKRKDIDSYKANKFRFIDCYFDRSSLICIRVAECKFERCKFKNVDLHGCTFTNCVFESCDFSLADIYDNVFFNCQFEEVDFTGATLKENEIKNVNFTNISLRGSLTSLNVFRQLIVRNSEFGNCTVDYNILENCHFYNSFLNIESLGTFFGLNSKALHDCNFLALGEQIFEPQEVIFERIRSYFEDKCQYVELFIFDINRSLSNLISGTEQLCIQMREKLINGEYVPMNQFQFIFYVYKELYKRGELGYLTLYRLIHGIQDILEQLLPTSRSYENLVLLYNNLSLLHNSITADLIDFSDEELHAADRPVILKFKFVNRPLLSLTEFLETCHLYVFGYAPKQAPVILAEQSGSYIVFLQTTIYTLLAFRICTYLLVGSVKELVKLRANVTLLTSKKLPRKYYLEVIRPETTVTIPQAIATILTGLIKKALPSPLKDIPVEEINKNNLEEILEVSAEDVPKKNHLSVK